MSLLAELLSGLRCSVCGCLDVLWLDPVRGLVECRECGQTALTLPCADQTCADSGEAL